MPNALSRGARAVLLLALLVALPCRAAPDRVPERFSVAERFALSGDVGWDYLTYDPTGPRLFIARSDRVQVVDPRSGQELGEVSGQQGVHGVALAPGLHLGFASNGRSNSVTAFDLATLKTVAEIKVTGVNPDAIVYVRETERVYTFNGGSNDVTVIDANSFEVVDTILLDGKPEFAVSDGKSLYVNLEDRAKLAEINLASDQVAHEVDLAPCEQPTGLAIDRTHQRLFSACSNGKLMVVDPVGARVVAEVPIGRNPDAIAYDSGSGLLFSASALGTLSVVHQDTADRYSVVQTVATMKSARTLALNPQAHTVYLVGALLRPPPAGDVRARPSVTPGTFTLLTVATAHP